ncbi:MAG: hypothetical protein OIN85_04775 [Candidatus Methanoperedens sp.]|nr:hypothetical protein [Candidatus Methanoperedens sp.]
MKLYIILSLAVLMFTISHPVLAQAEATPVPTNTAPLAKTITLDDDQKTINLQVDETFLLNLGEGYDWNISIDDQAVISREVNVMVIRGAQGIYRAHKPGSATLTAVGDPLCRKSVPACGAPSRLFRLNVVVSGSPAETPKAPAFEALYAIGTLLAALLLARRR